MTSYDLIAILPLIILALWAVLLILVDLVLPKEQKWITPLLAALGLLVTMGFALAQIGREYVAFGGMAVVDGFAIFLYVLFLGSGLVAVALAYDYLRRMDIEGSEYYILLMFSISGMMLMAIAADLIIVFLALELLSIPLYVLSGFNSRRVDSEEAALKYFLLGAFAGGFVVYGIALVFGAAGTTGLAGIADAVAANTASLPLLAVGGGLILVGLGFKVAAVPFHMWTPDVYQGAPTSATAFMSVGAKAAGFAALLRVFVVAFPAVAIDLAPILWAMSALTMIVGNVVAIAQRDIKRMLAYSSIAHAGYIMMVVVPYAQASVLEDVIASVLFYLLAYAFTSFGAWAVVITLERAEQKGLDLEDYAGLGRKYPALAAAMTVFMMSFIGIPPTLGFLGKFFLFNTVIKSGYIGLALIGVLTSLISAYYYLRVVVYMYMRTGEPAVHRETWLRLTAGVAAVATVLLSLIGWPLFTWASQAVMLIF